MSQVDLTPGDLITRSLTRSEAEGFGLALTLMDALVNPTSEGVMLRLQEIARGETTVYGGITEDIEIFERLSGNEIEPEKKLMMIDDGTQLWRKLNAETQETARRLVDFMAGDLLLSRRFPKEEQGISGE